MQETVEHGSTETNQKYIKLNMLHTGAGPETELQTAALLRVTTFNGSQATEKPAL